MTAPVKLLLLDDVLDLQGFLATSFPESNTAIIRASTPEDALAQASKERPAIAFIDGDDPDRAEAVQPLKAAVPSMKIVVLSSGDNTDPLVDLWFSYCPPDVTVARPIRDDFLARQLDDVLGSKKRCPRPLRLTRARRRPRTTRERASS